MTVTINGTTGIDKVQDAVVQNTTLASGVPGRSKLPAGTVLQVVQSVYSTSWSTSSTSFVDTNLSATITPTSTTSKILVLVNQGGFLAYTGGTTNEFYVNLVRNSTQVSTYKIQANISGQEMFGNFIKYLDSPNTISAVTYKTQAAVGAGSSNIYFQWGGSSIATTSSSTITLMEIAA